MTFEKNEQIASRPGENGRLSYCRLPIANLSLQLAIGNWK